MDSELKEKRSTCKSIFDGSRHPFLLRWLLLSVFVVVWNAGYERALAQSPNTDRISAPVYHFTRGASQRYAVTSHTSFQTLDKKDADENRSLNFDFNYVYRLTFSDVASDTGLATATLRIEDIKGREWDDRGAVEFDSVKDSRHLRDKSNSWDYKIGAMMSGVINMKLDNHGKIYYWKFVKVDTIYNNEAKYFANNRIDQLTNLNIVTLPKEGIKELVVGKSWTAAVPIEMIGGPLRGNSVPVAMRFSLEKVTGGGADRFAYFRLNTIGPLFGGVENQSSVKGLTFEGKISQFDGLLVFSLDHGRIENFSFTVTTDTSLGDSGDPAFYHHHMESSYKLEHLSD